MRRLVSKKLLMLLVLICGIVTLYGTPVYAETDAETENYGLGEEYDGYCYYPERYFRFNLSSKSHITLYASWEHEWGSFELYDANGKAVLRKNELMSKKNPVSGTYSGQRSRNLEAGEYYLQVYQTENFTFRITAEDVIKLPKGTITSLKKAKSGQFKVTCASVDNALGYRIQYSTDAGFKKGTKTIYSPTATKLVAGLKKGTRYYVKVCPYNFYDDGVRVYGKNSGIKSIVTKR